MPGPVAITAWFSALLFFISRAKFDGLIQNWSRKRQFMNCCGVLLLWLHIALAFAVVHAWSHVVAERHVADRTEAVMGIRTGIGIYANWITAILWTYSAWDRTAVKLYRARTWITELILWFMFINAAIVFANTTSAVVFAIIAVLVVASNLTTNYTE